MCLVQTSLSLSRTVLDNQQICRLDPIIVSAAGTRVTLPVSILLPTCAGVTSSRH